MSDKSTENYLDNLLDSMNKLQDTDTKMSGADQDEFLKKFEDELENETYDEYLSNFEKDSQPFPACLHPSSLSQNLPV